MCGWEGKKILFCFCWIHRLTSRNLALVRRVGGGRWGAQRSFFYFTKLFYALALLYLFGETILCTSFALSWSAAMAAICARLPGTLLKSPLFRGGIAYQNISRQSWKQLQQRLTWSQLKHLHSRSALTVPTHFQQSSRLDYVWCVYSQPTFCFVVSFATNERN